MSIARAAAIVLAKELRLEFRSRELLTTTLVFVLMVIVLFSFSFDPTSEESKRFGPGLLWIAFLFAGSLMLNPSFAREQANDTLYALRLAPVEPFGILLGKILANLAFLLLTELLLLPVFAVLYNVAVLPVLGRLVVVLLLGTLGLAVTGTSFSAISAQARMRELLLPLLLLPVLTPVLIASVECTAGLLGDPAELRMNWLNVLIAFDVIFLAASYLLCDTLLEE
ncbi:MAG: heme exporter protein CcmB [Acidobacteria bacterium]|nr:heme exporter protein CcmB [Acidobacteriota bacterium]MBI3663224.1 heme exporter protein CcmB [Acidobacteriota bacterium]